MRASSGSQDFFDCDKHDEGPLQAEFRRFEAPGEFHFPFRSNLIAK
jgi:hypothetical protein